MTDEYSQVEVLPLSCTITRDGLTIDVLIYRLAAESGGWTLQIVDEEHTSTTWGTLSRLTMALTLEFCDGLQTDGIRSFRTAALADTALKPTISMKAVLSPEGASMVPT
jgi:hypothetical protein